jgi:Cu(I)/Ag(I) efflux system periplasmic protein CusF
MKSKFLVAVAAALLASAALPATAFAHQGHNHQAEVAQTAEGTGVVRAINAQEGTVTLAHEPIAALGWPAMTMAFRARSADLLNGVAVGARVHFVLANDNGRPVLTEIHVLQN